MLVKMNRTYTNRFGKPIYVSQDLHDLPNGYAEFLIKNRFAEKVEVEGDDSEV